MDNTAQAATAGRDADLGLSSPYFQPLTGSQAQPNAFQDFGNSYGGELLNPTYNNMPLVSPTQGSAASWFSPNMGATNFGQSTDATINKFDQTSSSPAPSFQPPKLAGSQNTPGSSLLSPQPMAGNSNPLSVASSTVKPAGPGGPAASSPTAQGQPLNNGSGPSSATGDGGGMADPLKAFGVAADTVKKLLGLGGAAAVDKLVKVPAYPDMTEAARRIMAEGPLTPAGQEAERRMTDFLKQGPQLTPISQDYLKSVSDLFDNEMQQQLKMLDSKLQAGGAGGFGGGSGDAQYLRSQLVNKYSLEKTFYLQKMLNERLRADSERYYNTLTRVYGVSQSELEQLAQMEVEELAVRFQLDYDDATELKKAMGDMIYQATQDDYTKQAGMLADYGSRILQSITGGPVAAAGGV